MEGFSYLSDLQRYRPLIKVQAFIDYRKQIHGGRDGGQLPPDVEAKRKAVIRDWFRLVLWYIRLRKAARGQTPESLI